MDEYNLVEFIIDESQSHIRIDKALMACEHIASRSQALKLFVCATNVRSGQAKVFRQHEMSADAVMASACLPHIFKAVEIDGEAYWDGGFMGNPPIFPLINDTESQDIVLIQINPIEIENVPKTATEIRDSINNLSFNSSLMHEIRHINFIQKYLDTGLRSHPRLRNLYVHNIAPPKEFESLGVASKMNTNWKFLQKLRDMGRKQADAWLEQNYDKLGGASTCDMQMDEN